MAETVGQIKWVLDADTGQFEKGLARASSEAKSFSKKIGDYFESSANASFAFAKGLATVTTAFAGLSVFGLKTAGDLESARQGFVTILGAAEKADAVIARIKREAAATPFELPGLIQATQALAIVNKDGNKSIDILLNVGKALAAAGKGQAELDRIIANLQQIGLTGKITEMDIRQFGMAGVNILELLGESYGVTTAEAGEMVKDSKDALGDLEKAFAKAAGAGGKFENAFRDQGGTFNQLWSNMKDTAVIFSAEFVKTTGIFDAVKDAMSGLIDFANKNKDQIFQGVITVLGWLKNNGATVAALILGALTPALLSMARAILLNTLRLAPWALAFAGIFWLWQNNQPLLWAIASAITAIGAALLAFRIAAIIPLIPTLFTLGLAWVAAFLPFILIGAAVGVAVYLIVRHWQVLKSAASSVKDWIFGQFGAILGFFRGIPGAIAGVFSSAGWWLYDAGRNIVLGLKNGITSMITSAVNAIRSLGSSIIGGIKNILGIRSPSKVMASIGENLMQGLSKGMVTAGDTAVGVAGRISNSLAGEFSSLSADVNINGSASLKDEDNLLPTKVNNSVQISLGVFAGSPDELRVIGERIKGEMDKLALARGV